MVETCGEESFLAPLRVRLRMDAEADWQRPCARADAKLVTFTHGVAQADYGMQLFIGLVHPLMYVRVQGRDDMKTLLCNLPKIGHDGVSNVLAMILVRQGGSVAPSDEGREGKFAEPSFTGPVEVWGKDPN
jgi:hypothetical protein